MLFGGGGECQDDEGPAVAAGKHFPDESTLSVRSLATTEAAAASMESSDISRLSSPSREVKA